MAAAIVVYHLRRNAGDLMLSVGHYHSHTPGLRDAYQSKVVASAWKLYGRSTQGTVGRPP